MSEILLTGGAGYIGSHTAVEMINAGYDIVIADDFSNSSPVVIDRMEQITGTRPVFYPYDVCDKNKMREIFAGHDICGVVHFAGFKVVGESVGRPLEYYRNNIDSALTVLEVMKEHDVSRAVFSSSAAVYGLSNPSPCVESMSKGECSTPYGRTKSMIEQIFCDAAAADPGLSVVLLRYFNPVGAHGSGLMGENPKGIPNNLMPFISQVAIGRREELTVFGDDYDTPDGTCLRDYIHVVDLALAHVKAMEYAARQRGTEVFNIGTGVPRSVLDMIKAFIKANDVQVNYRIGARREGDLAEVWADVSKAKELLGWEAEKSLEDMCRDAWKWQSENPEGFDK